MERILAWMAERERDIAASPPRHGDLIQILRQGTSLDLRRMLVCYYGRPDLYGHGHGLVRALYADPFVNYYRLDSAPALHYTFVDGEQPLLVFLKPFADAQAFEGYYGGTPEAFLDAVGEGRILPTVGPADIYQSPFMRSLFADWARLPEETWPAYANVVQASAKDRPPSAARTEAEGAFGRLCAQWDSLPKQHAWTIAGQPSGLPPENPLTYVPERLKWFDLTLPGPAWDVLNTRLAAVAGDHRAREFAAFMDLTHVLQGVFTSQVLYSKGPSMRVAPIDILHWRDVLVKAGEPLRRRIAKVQSVGDAASRAKDALSLLDGVGATLSKALPSLARQLDGMFRRVIPASVRGRAGRAVLKLWGKVLDKERPLGGATEVKRKVQVQYVQPGGPDADEVDRLAREFEETLRGTLQLPGRLKIEKSKCVHKWTSVGGTVALSLVPAASPLVKTLDLSWKTVDALRTARLPAKVWAELNPRFQLGLDVLGDPPRGTATGVGGGAP